MSPGGVKCVIMGEEVCTDKEKGGREKTQLKACGSEGKGKGAHFHRDPASRASVPGLSDPVTRVEGKKTARGQSTSRAARAGKLFFYRY